jgi:redox-sensitive bicupin YhaK (pirin superfamily)
LSLIASRDSAQGSLLIHQDARIYSSVLTPDHSVPYELAPWRNTWIQVVSGHVRLEHGDGAFVDLAAGDGAAISRPGETAKLTLLGAPAPLTGDLAGVALPNIERGRDEAEILVFDLP